ncbi:S49 family peptidase [Curvivirga aplysinae]|uniref:S49 family peptidase n=1 Tax=Curvivirga aplysinae TaxID=2529852 RepID=UPI0012BBE9BE|nr:S49 family peptidase [Curvivirga aplysinae]MTI08292.1 S49 family peptidase [Curvivirga aplysinae]
MSNSSKAKKSKLRYIPFIGHKLAEKQAQKAVISVLRLNGVIGAAGFMKKGLSLEALEEVIEKAFEEKQLKAVALSINSPGGSPVQSALIAARIREKAKEKDVPVYAFCEDAAASGGYWLACAGDEIYAHSSSIVGSIGVISAGFGFPELLEKIGVERRVYTSGESKSQLDPFSKEKASDIKHLKSLQNDIHEQFKDYVRSRREGKLTEEEKKLFSGSFWTGAKAAEYGLVDGLGELRNVCKDKFGDKTKFKEASAPKSFIQRKLGLEGKFAGLSLSGVGEDIMSSAEERSWWARIGL